MTHTLHAAPALVMATGMAAGIGMAAGTPEGWVPAAAVSMLAIGVALALWRRSLRAAGVLLVSMALGMAASELRMPPLPDITGHGRWLATVSEADTDYGQLRAVVTVCACVDSAGCRRDITPVECYMVSSDLESDIRPGTEIAVDGFLEPINPGTDLDGASDYDSYLESRGITSRLHATRGTLEVTGLRHTLLTRAAEARATLCDMAAASGMKPSTVRMVQASALGQRRAVMPELREAMTDAGLGHLMALSGLHVGFVALLAWGLTFALRGIRPLRGLVVVASVWAYALLAGAGVSVVRAAVMVTAATAAMSSQRRASPVNALALAAVAIMAFRPYGLSSPGCVMTFAATAAMLLIAAPLNARLREALGGHRLMCGVLSVAVTSVTAFAATAMTGMYYFHYLPLWALPANMAVAPLVPVVIAGGLCVTLVSAAGVPCGLAARCVDLSCDAMEWISLTVARSPRAVADGLWIGPEALVAMGLTLGAVALALHFRRPRLWSLPAAGVVLTVCVACTGPWGAVPEAEMCVTRCHVAPVVIVREGSDITVLTSAKADTAAVRGYLDRGYGEYFRRYGNKVAIVTADCRGRSWRRRGNSVMADGMAHIVMVDRDTVRVDRSRRPDYALISGLWRGDAAAMTSALGADTAVIGADMGVERSHRLSGLCERAGVPTRALRRGAMVWRRF